MTFLLFALVWWGTFPATAWLLALCTGSKPYLRSRALVAFRASPLLRKMAEGILSLLPGKIRPRAFTWAFAIFTWRDLDRDLLADLRTILHERNHALWGLVLGLGYPLGAYPGGALVAVAKGGHWYRDNFWERIARRAAGEES